MNLTTMRLSLQPRKNMLKTLTAVLTVALLNAVNVDAFDQYNDQVPNGGNFGKNLGHGNPKAGGTSYNQFALDLKASGQTWTAALCKKDSDNDGQTNGHELGDPCCGTGRALWKVGTTPTCTAAQASDPSVAGSKSALPPGCPAAAAPTPVPVVAPTPINTPVPAPTPTPVITPPKPGQKTCFGFQCDALFAGYTFKLPGDGSNLPCLEPTCIASECCIYKAPTPCTSYTCPAGYTKKSNAALLTCTGNCAPDACCAPQTSGATDPCSNLSCETCIPTLGCNWCSKATGGQGCVQSQYALAACVIRDSDSRPDTTDTVSKCPSAQPPPPPIDPVTGFPTPAVAAPTPTPYTPSPGVILKPLTCMPEVCPPAAYFPRSFSNCTSEICGMTECCTPSPRCGSSLLSIVLSSTGSVSCPTGTKMREPEGQVCLGSQVVGCTVKACCVSTSVSCDAFCSGEFSSSPTAARTLCISTCALAQPLACATQSARGYWAGCAFNFGRLSAAATKEVTQGCSSFCDAQFPIADDPGGAKALLRGGCLKVCGLPPSTCKNWVGEPSNGCCSQFELLGEFAACSYLQGANRNEIGPAIVLPMSSATHVSSTAFVFVVGLAFAAAAVLGFC